LQIEEVTPEGSAPILQRYLKAVPVVRPFFDVTPHSQLADFVAEAPRHPQPAPSQASTVGSYAPTM